MLFHHHRAAIARPLPSLLLCASLACLASFTSLAPRTMFAQTPRRDIAPEQLAPVVVTASRQPTRVEDQVAHVTVIERAEIERASGRTLAELLAQQPGIQFAANGGLGGTSSVFIRGMESRHTLLLVDGMRYGSATVGAPSLDNLPLDQIERIEIVRGPLSGLYGSEAVAGVIQIFTRRGREGFFPHASATVGSRSYGQLAAGIATGSGPWDLAVNAQHTDTNGFSASNARAQFGNFNPDHDGFRQSSGSVNAGYRFNADWRARASLLGSAGTTRFDNGPGADTRARLSTEVMTLGIDGRLTERWRTALRVGRSEDEFDTVVSVSPASLGAFRTTQRQLSWENTFTTPIGSLLLLAETLDQDVSKAGTQFPVQSRQIDSASLGLTGGYRAHVWQANARRDRNSQFGTTDTGSLGYGYDLTRTLRLGASAGTSFVAPSFNQLYFPAFGNPNLQPEEGRHNEFSVRYAEAGHEVRAARFQNRIRGFITSGAQPVNVPTSSIDGWTVTYAARISAWTLGATLETVEPRNDLTGRLLPRRARDTAKANADVDLGDWRFGASLLAVGRRFENTTNTIALAGFYTLDLRADRVLTRDWTLGLRVNNLNDKIYETAFGFNQPRREAYLTLRYAPK